jgi:hypothetical protein
MKKVFRLLVAAMLVGGWGLAALSLHVVRSPGSPQWLGRITLLPKDRITWRQTWVDTTKWTSVDLVRNAAVVERIHKAQKDNVLRHVSGAVEPVAPSPVKVEMVEHAAGQATPAVPQPEKKRSIFEE